MIKILMIIFGSYILSIFVTRYLNRVEDWSK